MKIFAVIALALFATASANPLLAGLLGGSSSSSSASSSSSSTNSASAGLLGGIVGGKGELLGGILGGEGGLLGGVIGTATGLVGGITKDVVGTVGGVVQSVVGVVSGLTVLAGGLVAGVVGTLSKVLSDLLLTFTDVLTKLDITGTLKEPIKLLTQTMVAVTSGLTFFGGSTGSVSSGSTSSSSGSTISVSGSVESTGHNSVDFVATFSPKLQGVLELILKFENLANFDFRAAIVGLLQLVVKFTPVSGEKIIGSCVKLLEQVLALIEAVVKAVAVRDFGLVANIGIQLTYILIVSLDFFSTVGTSIFGGITGAIPGVVDLFNVANGFFFAIINVLFTAVQTVIVASQATLNQIAQGANSAIQAAIQPAQTAFANLIQIVQTVLQPVNAFIRKFTVLAHAGLSFDARFSSTLNAEMNVLIQTVVNTYLQIAAAFRSILGTTVTGLGQLVGNVFADLNIQNEIGFQIKSVASSAIDGSFGLLRLVQTSRSVTYSG